MRALAVIWAPIRTLVEVAEERRILLGFGVVALYAALQLGVAIVDVLGGVTATSFDPEDFPGVPPEILENFSQGGYVGIILSAVLSPLVGWVVVSLLMRFVTRLFGGTGPASSVFAAVGVAAVPLVIASVIQLPLTALQASVGPESAAAGTIGLVVFLLFLIAYAWNVVLVVIGAAFARRISYGRSAGSCAIVGIIGAVFILILIAVLGVLVFVLLGEIGATP